MLTPSCAILNGTMTSLDPLEICWMLRQQNPTMGIFILASSPDEEHLFQFVKRGASAYETRSISEGMLVDRVRRVCDGEYVVTSEALLSWPSGGSSPPGVTRRHKEVSVSETYESTSTFPLSAREVEMLDYIARGNSNKELAKALQISDQTVKNHITSILKKLSVDDRTAAVVHALRHGWIELEPSIR